MPQPHLIRLQCTACKEMNYYSRKNQKKVEKKLSLNKYCKTCKKSVVHKEKKIKGK